MVTESGCDVPGESALPPESALQDNFRVEYYRSYLAQAMIAKHQDGVDLQARATPTLEADCRRR